MIRRAAGTALVVGLLALLWPAPAQAQCVHLDSGYGTRKGIDNFVLDVLDGDYEGEVGQAAAAWNACAGVALEHAPSLDLNGSGGPTIEINHVNGMSAVCGDSDVNVNGGTITIYVDGPSTCPV